MYMNILTDSDINGTEILALPQANVRKLSEQNLTEGYAVFSVTKSMLACVKRANHTSWNFFMKWFESQIIGLHYSNVGSLATRLLL